MAVPSTLPAPAMNLISESGRLARVSGIVAADVIVALGDYTGGAADDLFTLTSHGLIEGDHVHCIWQTAIGAFTGGEGTRGIVHYLSSSTFQVNAIDGTGIENTADGTVAFLKGRVQTQVVQTNVIPYIIAGVNDFTGSTVEDMVTAVSGLKGALDGDTLKLLYKSAAGAAAVAVDATVFVKSPVTPLTVTLGAYFQTSLTAGGAVADTTADGTVIFLKTS